MKSIKEVANELAQLRHHRYIVERYLVSLSQLTVVARPKRDLQSVEGAKFITFRTVKYMQMPTYWENAPFLLGTPRECRALLNNVGIDIVDRLPRFFYAQLPKSCVRVVCWSADISDIMPP
jgi:hypothetical protein